MKLLILLSLFFLVPGLFVTRKAAAASRPRIFVLATGGTIAGRADTPTALTAYQAGTLRIESLLATVPPLRDIANVTGETICDIDSKDMTEEIWLRLARRVNELFAEESADGVVITHGTDTLEETAYFLNLTVKSDRPVVLTGAMRPATSLSADGPLNLLDAVRTAASPDAAGKGVLIVMNGEINAARDVAKTNTLALDAFQSPDMGLLGYVNDGIPTFYRQTRRYHTAQSEFDVTRLASLPPVKILYGHAADDALFVEAAVRAGVRGLVYAGLGNGSIPQSVETALTEAAARGVIVVRASRTGSGAVVPERSPAGSPFLSAGTLSPQKARILLQLALTRTANRSEIQRMFLEY